jgi:hypothetical protein
VIKDMRAGLLLFVSAVFTIGGTHIADLERGKCEGDRRPPPSAFTAPSNPAQYT